MKPNPPSDSPLVDEIRARAMKISARFQHDPKKYLKHLKAAQRRHPSKLVSQITIVPANSHGK